MTREEAVKLLCDIANDYFTSDAEADALNLAIKALEDRKQGKWIHERLASTTGGSYPITRCSLCQCTMPFEWETPFCPYCGEKIGCEQE